MAVVNARFIEPMLLLPTDQLPAGPGLCFELKLDGYRALAFKTGERVHLRSRNNKDFNRRYPAIVSELAALPDETVVDGEVVALEADGRPSFAALQNAADGANLVYYVFDVLVLCGRDVMAEPLTARRALLSAEVLPALGEPVRESPVLEADLSDLLQAVKANGLEGLVAKRLNSRYEPGQRTGAWLKHRVNQGREFVIGGYTPGPHGFDAVIVGHYVGGALRYVARTRNGFTPTSRSKLLRLLKPLETTACPFVNLPEAHAGRWGVGLTAEKMAECRWLRPQLVAAFEYLEVTADGHLRHACYVGLRDDRAARDVAGP